VRGLVPMVLVHPVDLLNPGAEAPTPDHGRVAVGRLALPRRLGIGDHAEAASGEKGEGFGVVGHLSSMPQGSAE